MPSSESTSASHHYTCLPQKFVGSGAAESWLQHFRLPQDPGAKLRWESACLSSIILSPLNGYVQMSPYETGDICIESERIATSGGDFIVCEGGPGVCPSRLPAQPNASTCQTTQISVTAR